jgi:purine-binding chemotaxis protein CheW
LAFSNPVGWVGARRLLLFRSAGHTLAIDAGAAREILPGQTATRIPGAGRAVRGLVNVRGVLVTLIDAAAAMGLDAGPASPSGGAVLVLEYKGRRVGLVVDEVLDLAAVDDADLDGRGALPGVRPDLVQAVGATAGRSFVQLETDALLEPLLP